MNSRQNKKVVFIIGAGHSGSTLLGFILGSHPDGFYGGELTKSQFLNNPNQLMRKRVCKLCEDQCPVWSDFVISNQTDLYEQLSLRTAKPVIIDSAKNIHWLQKQIEVLNLVSTEIALVFLVRDGRAVVNSRIRKTPDLKIKELIVNWMATMTEMERLFDAHLGLKYKVHYEKLASSPEETMRELCAGIQMAYSPTMLNYYNYKHHPLGGNVGTQYLVARAYQNQDQNQFVQLSERNEYYYKDHPLAIRLDMRWRNELSDENLQLFQELAGDINCQYQWNN